MKRTRTMKLQGNDYAKVTDRLKEFRKDCPQGLIETTPTMQSDGSILFRARILKDKSNESSGEATGHALGENKGSKSFEKLETIAVGRALALLGYASDGEIASSEEMEEFEAYKMEQHATLVSEMKERIEETKSLDDLKDVWASIPVDIKAELESLKEEMKKKFSAPQPEKPVRVVKKTKTEVVTEEGKLV